MPTYQYKCEFCDFEFEQIKPMSKSDESEGCPQCGSECRKIITGGSGFLLKGDGWFRDGYSDPIKVKETSKNKEIV